MFRILPILILILLLAAVGCQSGAGNAADEPSGDAATEQAAAQAPAEPRTGPAIGVEPALIELGEMDQQETRSFEVVIRSVGTDTLRLNKPRTSCGCTAADLETDVLAPGASTPLKGTFNSKKFVGDVKKYIRIPSNDPEHDLFEVVLTATINVPIVTDPPKPFISNLDIPHDEGWTDRMTFFAKDEKKLELSTDFESDVMQITFEPRVDGDPRRAAMVVTVPPGATPGDYHERIVVKTNVEKMPTMDLTVRVRILGDLRLDRDYLNLGVATPGQPVEGEVTITPAKGDLDYEILGAEVDLPEFQADVDPAEDGGRTVIHLHGVAVGADDERLQAGRGRVHGEMTIRTNLPDQPEMRVKLFYMVRS